MRSRDLLMKACYNLELLTPCYGDGVNPGTPNYPKHAAAEILDPTKENTYTFMRELFSDLVRNISKDQFVHLGMDEVIKWARISKMHMYDIKENTYLPSRKLLFRGRFTTTAGNHLLKFGSLCKQIITQITAKYRITTQNDTCQWSSP